MFRTFACGAAAFMVAATSALAGQIEVNGAFRVTVPDDWTQEPSPIPSIALIVISPRRPETGGNCNFIVTTDEATKSMSQSEIETQLSGEINENWWREGIAAARGVKSTKIDKSGSKKQRGRKVFYVQATSDFVIQDTPVTVTQVVDLHAIPGRTYVVTCTARAEAFAQEASAFKSIMDSFEPTPDMTVAAVRPQEPSPVAELGRGPAIARSAAKAASDSLTAGSERARAK